MWEKRDDPAGKTSFGPQKLPILGCCIANDADLLLIDEPVAGIDTENWAKIIALVRTLKSESKTILQIEHHLGDIEATSDKTLHLESGGTCQS